ncbi:MAG: hypothetical protein JSR77_16080 [Planctomycetes bacterium]|nr:hypothetical protein [Planctomycetota bacterium]
MDATGPIETTETFTVADGYLVRSVVPRRGTPYQHRCTLANYQAVAYAIEDLKGGPTTLEQLAAATGLPNTQVNVAFAFLKERGCVVPAHGRRHKAASSVLFEDAMTEYHALREEAPGH